MILNKNIAVKCFVACLLFVSSAAAFSQDATTASAPSHWRTLLLELILLLPLAALAWKLKSKNKTNKSNAAHDIEEGKCIRISNGANAQIIRANQHVILIVHGKNGSTSLLDLGVPQIDKNTPPVTNALPHHESDLK